MRQAHSQPEVRLYPANHTFMRDDGYRYDPVATDDAWAVITTFLQQQFEPNGNPRRTDSATLN